MTSVTILKTSDQETVYAGIRENKDGYTCEPGRVRRKGGGRKRKLDQRQTPTGTSS